MSLGDLRLAPGEVVLVTGANGYIASHVVDTLLDQGYNVRGTVRSEKDWLIRHFDSKYGAGRFETHFLTSMDQEHAFDDAVKGVSGIIHVASDTVFKPDASAVIPKTIAATLNLLEAAAKEKSVKSFVLTSSSWAALMPVPNTVGVVDENSWNDAAVDNAWNKKAPADVLPAVVYAASKVEAEKTFWKWTRDTKPSFAFNAVLPSYVTGNVLHPEIPGSTMARIRSLLVGETQGTIDILPPQWYVDVRDVARVHVAALVAPTVQSQRLFAFAGPFNWTDVVGILNRLRPENKAIPAPRDNEGRDLYDAWKVSRLAEDIMRSVFQVNGWTSLENSVGEGIADVA